MSQPANSNNHEHQHPSGHDALLPSHYHCLNIQHDDFHSHHPTG
jgi:hypothetical protein